MSARVPTVTRPIPGMLTRAQAAVRVGRSQRTIRNWQMRGLRTLAGLIPEGDLLEYDRRMRERVGRPRKAGRPDDVPFIRELVEAGNDELMDELGPVLVTIHDLPITHPDRARLVGQARAVLWREFGKDTELVLSAVTAGVEYALDLKAGGSES